jgi:hypothetical protein
MSFCPGTLKWKSRYSQGLQHVAITKLINPLRGGTSLEIIPLHVQTFIIHVQVATITNEPMKGSERSTKEWAKHVDLSFNILNSRIKCLEFLPTSLFSTPH